ncbi:MAG: class I SAM-dependent methyltransferase [Bacteroidota bacterium]|nr:class I SAM-dependent methyltransferase [Bacteroidota bacterium]
MSNPAKAANDTISAQFLKIREKDKDQFIKDWLVTWEYQEIRKKRKIGYDDEIITDFFEFNSAEELVKWMNWFGDSYPDYIGTEKVKELIAKSRKTDEQILSKLGQQYDMTRYDHRIGMNNAHDFLLPQIYPVPERNRIHTVLDFGAGYGRQANLWTADGSVTYIGMDAIVSSYCLQNLYYKTLAGSVVDYIEDPAKFKIDTGKKGIFHLPTWRTDLVPDNSLDLVMCVQVLPELNPRLVRFMMKQFHRMLKPGGALYIRDHAYTWKPTGEFNVEKYLSKNGFVLEYKAHIINDSDLHGIPRIWRKVDPKVVASQTRTFDQFVQQMKINLDTLSGGRLKKLMGKSPKS